MRRRSDVGSGAAGTQAAKRVDEVCAGVAGDPAWEEVAGGRVVAHHFEAAVVVIVAVAGGRRGGRGGRGGRGIATVNDCLACVSGGEMIITAGKRFLGQRVILIVHQKLPGSVSSAQLVQIVYWLSFPKETECELLQFLIKIIYK